MMRIAIKNSVGLHLLSTVKPAAVHFIVAIMLSEYI